jgi:glutathione reductase (NADPH)
VYASHFREDFEDATGFGWNIGSTAFDWATLIANKDREIERLNRAYRDVLENSGVTILPARATLVDANTVAVGDRRLTARYILIATGARPFVPDAPGCRLGITSDQAFHLAEQPRRIVIVGGGYIAVEFAGIFNGLGSQVTQLYRGELFLRGFDDDVRAALAEAMRGKGIDLRFRTDVKAVEKTGAGRRVHLTDGSALDTDQVMFATGRLPRIEGLGLSQAGVEVDADGAICVDEYSRTRAGNIYAVGDVTNRVNLTPVALAEAGAFVETVFRGHPTPMDYRDIPTVVFGQPSLGAVGLTEQIARSRFAEVDVYRSKFRPLKHTLSGRGETVLLKLVVDRASDRVVGAHMLGPEAGEIIQGIAIAMKCGATKKQFDATIGVHPTVAEEWVTMRTPA